eukprot:TRINITY_DN26008_c0_g2_i2.p1 TRINITY_DN26008_c0_g2~~TRINITY_DN26008_c0_g2_i2.p1  ORF type:complete len:395 (+),score=24.01 TRINITY_DN26008_c0_g2_i2:192-1376(+)
MGQTVGSYISPNVDDLVFPAVEPSYNQRHRHLVRLTTSSKGGAFDIPAMLLLTSGKYRSRKVPSKCKTSQSRDAKTPPEPVTTCVIYFHQNKCDIGDCLSDMAKIRDGAFGGDAVVLAPEYPGYGLLCEYRATVKGIERVGLAAWRYCRETLGFKRHQIILWGRSIGCGPAASLAVQRAQKAFRKVEDADDASARSLGALVLVAPYTSISDVVKSHSNRLIASMVSAYWPVLELMADAAMIHVPVLIMHPTEDEIIPVAHGQSLYDTCVSHQKHCIWVEGKTHNFSMEAPEFSSFRSFVRRISRPARQSKPRDVSGVSKGSGNHASRKLPQAEEVVEIQFLSERRSGEAADIPSDDDGDVQTLHGGFEQRESVSFQERDISYQIMPRRDRRSRN